ncbi:MAG TPA: cupin domain-containing protein [Alphaproteobacteria bacterium]|nr:cupin domain-containing protein [Alphaproteobacteria bacterium]
MTLKIAKSPLGMVIAAGTLATSLLASASAFAGDCPAGKTGVEVTKPGPMMPSGVTDTVIASVDLAAYGIPGKLLRTRRLVLQPGGIVPWHSHKERPANIYVESGTVTEYRSTCAVPIMHPAGDITAEQGDLSHWWKNTGKTEAVILSADVFTQPTQPMASGMSNMSDMDHGM